VTEKSKPVHGRSEFGIRGLSPPLENKKGKWKWKWKDWKTLHYTKHFQNFGKALD